MSESEDHGALLRAFEVGAAQGRDPANTGARGAARTTDHSWWFTAVCTVCRHTFRKGDAVWVDEVEGAVRVRHDSAALDCRSGVGAVSAVDERARALIDLFNRSADLAAGGAVRVHDRFATRLGPHHPLLGQGRPERRKCMGCAHTFREGERVDFCPCRRSAQPCGAAAHRDPASGLDCFEVVVEGGMDHCPVTYQKIKPTGPAAR